MTSKPRVLDKTTLARSCGKRQRRNDPTAVTYPPINGRIWPKSLRAFALAALLFLLLALPAPAKSPSLDRPWEDEIIYAVHVPSFFDGNPANNIMVRKYTAQKDQLEGGYWGGDLAGVLGKLDYLTDLGVTTLFLSPVVQNDRDNFFRYLPGGYRPRDYFAVDENLGTMKDLQRLVDRAHARGMRVILDLPLALPGIQHPYYTRENMAKGWFGEDSGYGMRRWNAGNLEIADYLIRVAKFWREQTKCDGFRLDSVKLLPDAFWVRFAKEVRGASSRQQFFLMGEIVAHPSKIGEMIRDATFDSGYDFSFVGTAQNVLGNGRPVYLLNFVFREAKAYYPTPRTMCAEVDNYGDTFLKNCLEPKAERLKLALALMLTIDRIPLLYSGDEMATWPDERKVGALFDAKQPTSPKQPELRRLNRNPAFLKYVKRLIALRREQPALRRGDFLEVYNTDPQYAFLRTLGKERLLFVLNNSNKEAKVSFPVQGTAWKDLALYDLWEKRPRKAPGSDESLTLAPFGFALLKVTQ